LSQPRPESGIGSASEDENQHAVEDSSKEKVQHKIVIEISSDESEDSESEAEEEVEVEVEQDNGSEAEEDAEVEAESGVEDEFEGFDVHPEDKEFFNELLDITPPEAVMEFIGKTRLATPQPLSNTTPGAQKTKHAKIFAEVQTLSDIAPDVQRAKRVKIFAEDHPFREQDRWTEDELEEYKDDVHGFAKAAGFSDLHADLEVGKAMGAWKIERGISLPLPDESALLRATSSGRESVKESKKRRKAEKKARRKLNKREKESSRYYSAVPESTMQISSIPLALKQPKLQSSQSYYVKQATTASSPKKSSRSDVSLSTEDEKSVGHALKQKRMKKAEKKKLRKKAKLGPKKSEYFSNNLRDDPAPSAKPKDADIPKDQLEHREQRRQLKEPKKLLANAAHKGHGAHLDPANQMAQEAKKAVTKAPLLVKEVSTKKKEHEAATKMPTEPELVEKKRKNRNHKRNRNKNRLPEELSGKETPASVAIQAEEEMSDLPPKKKVRDESQKSNSAGEAGKVRTSNLASSKPSIVEYEESRDPSSSQQTFSQLGSGAGDGAGDGTGRPSKRRDRGRGRKPKSKNEDLEMPNPRELAVGEAAIPGSDYLMKSIETNEPSSKKKRKRSKSKSRDENVESSEVGGAADIEPLTELTDTNSKKWKEKVLGPAKRRARSVDAMEVDSRPSNQSSKVHHSQ
jgi:hypothetical protein